MISDSTIQALRDFTAERQWERFHTPENLAKSISIEAAELLECYQWAPSPVPDAAHAQEELADVLTYCVMMADALGVDMDDIIMRKLEKTKQKYPATLVRDDLQTSQQLHWQARTGRNGGVGVADHCPE
ncbi:nucleotide pyrophosphohydrolase [Bifidobacterium amazonense]|uniref:Nucleotide pyrophosphohydrolase n=1 Tax=Bifidobacterium amazonense TaxID=2809027 RepID=A0ABS9VZ27_9BIFI|nr:nucleotide pyrophosphohydrolase [Bifidobacterium amazonense]MCH9277040.1 nucleotide pyrophosphohydrolase [Bifidobacterium amazonense]